MNIQTEFSIWFKPDSSFKEKDFALQIISKIVWRDLDNLYLNPEFVHFN